MKYLILIISFIISLNGFAGFTDADKAFLNTENVFPNGGVEQGKVGWSANGGTSAIAIETTNKLSGKAAMKFTSSGATDYLATAAYAVKHGPNCMVDLFYKTTSSAFVLDVMEGTNVVATLPLTANTAFQEANSTFICSSATTTYHMHIRGGAASDIIYVDDYVMSKNMNVGSVNLQDKQYDISSYITSSLTIASIPRAIGIPYKTRDNQWRMLFNIMIKYSGTATAGTNTISGVTFKNTADFYQAIAIASGSGSPYQLNAYTNPNTSTFYFAISGNNWHMFSGDVELESKPTWATDYASEQVVRAENSNGFGSVLWANIASCTFSTTSGTGAIMTASACNTASTTYGNATSGNDNLELTTTNLKANTVYKITGMGNFYSNYSGSTTFCNFYITDGTNIIGSSIGYASSGAIADGTSAPMGYIKYSTAQPTKTFSIYAIRSVGSGSCDCDATNGSVGRSCGISIEEVSPTTNMPQIINSISSPYNGQMRMITAELYCNSSSTINAYNYGSGFSSIGNISDGTCAVTFTTGTFSAAPVCTSSSSNTSYTPIIDMQSNSSTGINMRGILSNGNPVTAWRGHVICVGPK